MKQPPHRHIKGTNEKFSLFSKSGRESAEQTKETLIDDMFPELTANPKNIKKIADLLTHSFSSHSTPEATSELLLFFHKNLNAKEQTLALNQLSGLHQKLKDGDPKGVQTQRLIDKLTSRQLTPQEHAALEYILKATGAPSVTYRPALYFISKCDQLSIDTLCKGAELLEGTMGINFDSKLFFTYGTGNLAQEMLEKFEAPTVKNKNTPTP